jgi:hypothetical protein
VQRWRVNPASQYDTTHECMYCHGCPDQDKTPRGIHPIPPRTVSLCIDCCWMKCISPAVPWSTIRSVPGCIIQSSPLLGCHPCLASSNISSSLSFHMGVGSSPRERLASIGMMNGPDGQGQRWEGGDGASFQYVSSWIGPGKASVLQLDDNSSAGDTALMPRPGWPQSRLSIASLPSDWLARESRGRRRTVSLSAPPSVVRMYLLVRQRHRGYLLALIHRITAAGTPDAVLRTPHGPGWDATEHG